MNCLWEKLLDILPQHLRLHLQPYQTSLQEVRLRLGDHSELIVSGRRILLGETITAQDLQFVVNSASRYSPWAAETVSNGYITAPGGHRIGLCGTAVISEDKVKSIRDLTSVNIRVARDFTGYAKGIPNSENVLILGPPGCGKTTLLRDLIRKRCVYQTVSVADEREELFPQGFARCPGLDVMSGCAKATAIELLLRVMGPQCIALDEITGTADAMAVERAAYCGVDLLATAHAESLQDLYRKKSYRKLLEMGVFSFVVVMDRAFGFRIERLNKDVANCGCNDDRLRRNTCRSGCCDDFTRARCDSAAVV